MTILKSITEGESLAKLHSWSAPRILQAFLANYVANLIISRVGDVASLAFINSRGSTYKHFSTAMGPVDFWAYVLFVASPKELKKYLSEPVISQVKQDAGRILDSRVEKVVAACKKPADLINWQEAIYSIMLLAVRFEINFPALQGIVRALHNWEKTGAAARAAAISQSLRFLKMTDPDSQLIVPLTNMTSRGFISNIINPLDTISNKVKGIFRVAEDDAAPAAVNADNPQAGQETTQAGAISPLPRNIFKDGKIIRRRKRNFKVLKWKDPSNPENKDYSNVKIA